MSCLFLCVTNSKFSLLEKWCYGYPGILTQHERGGWFFKDMRDLSGEDCDFQNPDHECSKCCVKSYLQIF